MKDMLFSRTMKLSDVIMANHSLVLALPRFGIELGFGEKTVEEVCEKHNISPDLFLMICNVYTFDEYLPDRKNLMASDLKGLVSYLSASHNYYLDERIPHIEAHLKQLAEGESPKQGEILMNFFNEYKSEVINHFDYEDDIIFPYIYDLIKGNPSKEYNIQQFEENHSNIEDKLSDLTNIIIKYLPGNIFPKDRISVLFDIFELSADLNKHALIEEKILIPYVEFLEKMKHESK